jgi:predicted hydrocarbon binding protein
MITMNPQLPIDVNPETGVWTTDSLPMLYVPRHFFTNNHVAVEEALGRDQYAQILYQAGYKSAYHWCDKEAKQHGLAGMDVFAHYLKRLSQRGWGQFTIASADPVRATACIELRNSSFVLAQPERQGKLCYMFAGWFAGAMDWVNDTEGRAIRSVSRETQCGGEGHAHCVFEVSELTGTHAGTHAHAVAAASA